MPKDEEDINNLIISVVIWVIGTVIIGAGLYTISSPAIIVVFAVLAFTIGVFYFHRSSF
ncbi:hypothetical protein ACFLVZ_00860 [Chloroflexota bacterium]